MKDFSLDQLLRYGFAGAVALITFRIMTIRAAEWFVLTVAEIGTADRPLCCCGERDLCVSSSSTLSSDPSVAALRSVQRQQPEGAILETVASMGSERHRDRS